MAPNRRNTQIVLQSSPILDIQVKAFPPLTSQPAQQQVPSQTKIGQASTIKASSTSDSKNYWEWTTSDKDEAVQAILEEEKAQGLVSAAHLEANLIHDSSSSHTESEVVRAPVVDEDYWYEGEQQQEEKEKKTAIIRKQESEESYWDWQSKKTQEENEGLVNTILEEDKICHLLSATHITNNILRQPAVQPAVAVASVASDKYWDWGSVNTEGDYWTWPATKMEQRELIREESSIQSKLVVSTGAESSYWDW